MQENQIPYACGQLAEIAYRIKLSTEQLKPLREIGDNLAMSQIAHLMQDIASMLSQSCLLMLEMNAVPVATYTRNLTVAVNGFHIQTPDYGKLVGTLSEWLKLIQPLIPDPETRTVSAAIVGRMMNTLRMGYYPTDPAHVAVLQDALVFPNHDVNLLDPCCGEGKALQILGENQKAITYGVELDEARAEEAQERLNRVALGSYYYSRISRGAFHLLFLNPPYLQMHGGARSEKRFLAESYELLMMGGVLVYIIPYYRLTEDICRFLAAHFNDLRIFKFHESEFKKHRQVLIIGKRKPFSESHRVAALLMAASFQPSKIPPLAQITDKSYALPNIKHDVPVFQGSHFNVRELSAQMDKTGSLLEQESALDNSEKRPPLPLTIGQIGLVGGSGLINGLIECDAPHVIKGRVIKVKDSYTASTEKNMDGSTSSEIVETTSNKMVFNLLTPDGVKELT